MYFHLLLIVSIWKKIEYLDQTFFLKINRDCSNELFDIMMPLVRQASFWAPLYLFLLAFAIINFGWKGWMWILVFIAAIALSDQISSHFLKNWFQRIRPCQDPVFKDYIMFRAGYRPTSFSFTSSHAANHFTMAMFIFTTARALFGKWMKLFFVWAFIICYAQVYVGVHYPLDILGGTLVGLMVGYVTGSIFNKYINLEDELALD